MGTLYRAPQLALLTGSRGVRLCWAVGPHVTEGELLLVPLTAPLTVSRSGR